MIPLPLGQTHRVHHPPQKGDSIRTVECRGVSLTPSPILHSFLTHWIATGNNDTMRHQLLAVRYPASLHGRIRAWSVFSPDRQLRALLVSTVNQPMRPTFETLSQDTLESPVTSSSRCRDSLSFQFPDLSTLFFLSHQFRYRVVSINSQRDSWWSPCPFSHEAQQSNPVFSAD